MSSSDAPAAPWKGGDTDGAKRVIAEGDLLGLLKQRVKDAKPLMSRIFTVQSELTELRQKLKVAEAKALASTDSGGGSRGETAALDSGPSPTLHESPIHVRRCKEPVSPQRGPSMEPKKVWEVGETSRKSKKEKSGKRAAVEICKMDSSSESHKEPAAVARRRPKKSRQSRDFCKYSAKPNEMDQGGERPAGEICKMDRKLALQEVPAAAARDYSKKKGRGESGTSEMGHFEEQAPGEVSMIEWTDAYGFDSRAKVEACGIPSPVPDSEVLGRTSTVNARAKKGTKSGTLPRNRKQVDSVSELTSDALPSRSEPRVESCGANKLSREADALAHDMTSAGETPRRVARHAVPLNDLIRDVNTRSLADDVTLSDSSYVDGGHCRKMRTLVLNPANADQCATAGLDGMIKVWHIDAKHLNVKLRNSVSCRSPSTMHWPEALAWHPEGHSIFGTYTADGGDSQVAVVKNDEEQRSGTFLLHKAHGKGLLNELAFLPWNSSLFVTAGSDHAVHLWRDRDRKENDWKAKLLHGSIHSSSVSGVAGTYHRELVLSTAVDKKIIGFDPAAGRMAFRIDLEAKALNVHPNAVDVNLIMVQTGMAEQLCLFDIRTHREVHRFGWKQETSEARSALIDQSWSPDGYHVVSGTVDPKIVLFDIRCIGREPAQTFEVHTSRVYKAVWHSYLPVVFSISADRKIGIHEVRNL